jgi:hypothetical protein
MWHMKHRRMKWGIDMATDTDRKVFQRLRYIAVWATTYVCVTGASTGIAAAAPPPLQTETPWNKGVVELETGVSPGSVRIAEDLAAIIDDGATRRILPVIGSTAMQSFWDLAYLRGIDMAILPADVLDGIRRQRGASGFENTYTYIAKLGNEEFHLLAGPAVKTIADLANQKVNVDVRGSGTSETAQRLFGLLNIPITQVNDRQDQALEKLRRGEIAAMVFVAEKPARIFRDLKREDGLHFISIPSNTAVINAYAPTFLTSTDYPALIQNNQPIDTITVATVLAVANLIPDSERYRNVKNFVEIFFTQYPSLLEPGHDPMWHEINLAAELPGWRRFPPAQQWLDREAVASKQKPSAVPQDMQAMFSRFLDARSAITGGTQMTAVQKQELFDQYRQWQAQSGSAR